MTFTRYDFAEGLMFNIMTYDGTYFGTITDVTSDYVIIDDISLEQEIKIPMRIIIDADEVADYE